MSDQPIVAITRATPVREGLEAPVVGGARVKMAPALPQMSRAELLEFVKGAAVVVSMFHDNVDAEFLRAAGVRVTNTPDAVTEGTANIAWALLLAVARRVCEGDRFVRSGRFETEGNIFPTGWLGVHLTGQTMLIVGAGRIGRAVAMRAHAFGMRVLYTARSRHLDFEQAPLAARRVELEEGLREADVVSLHTPLTNETKHLINAARLGMMKATAVLVNTARGPVVDEAALAEALKAKKIWGAGLDVFEREPAVHAGLLSLENVVMTPHIGSGERYWREEMTRMVCENAGAILAGRRPPNLVS
jgi:glyoxylate reductase